MAVEVSYLAPPTITYTYDPLNRLAAADYSYGDFFHYAYDAVGNRLSEITASGTTTYTYTSNKLSSVTRENLNITFQYNGLGERVSQTVNGVTFTVDLNAGLTQVLDDGALTYLYSKERFAQYDATGAHYSAIFSKPFIEQAESTPNQLPPSAPLPA